MLKLGEGDTESRGSRVIGEGECVQRANKRVKRENEIPNRTSSSFHPSAPPATFRTSFHPTNTARPNRKHKLDRLPSAQTSTRSRPPCSHRREDDDASCASPPLSLRPPLSLHPPSLAPLLLLKAARHKVLLDEVAEVRQRRRERDVRERSGERVRLVGVEGSGAVGERVEIVEGEDGVGRDVGVGGGEVRRRKGREVRGRDGRRCESGGALGLDGQHAADVVGKGEAAHAAVYQRSSSAPRRRGRDDETNIFLLRQFWNPHSSHFQSPACTTIGPLFPVLMIGVAASFTPASAGASWPSKGILPPWSAAIDAVSAAVRG